MKIFAVAFLLFVIGEPLPKTNELVGQWFCVSHTNGSGLVLDFKSDKELVISSVVARQTKSLNYKWSNNKLWVKRNGKYEKFGQIEGLSKNGFTMLASDSTTLEFLRIKDVKSTIGRERVIEELQNTSWVLRAKSDSIRIDFLDTHRWDNNEQPYEAIFHYWLSGPSKEKETWTIGEYDGKLFISYTNYQNFQFARQIERISSNKIILTSPVYVEDSEALSLERKNDLTDEQNREFLDIVCDRIWKSTSIDTAYAREGMWMNGKDITGILSFNDLKKQFEFSFRRDKTYQIRINGQNWRTGNWKNSRDGEFIILDDQRYKNNWVNISANKNNLVLAYLGQFNIEDRRVRTYLLKIKLE